MKNSSYYSAPVGVWTHNLPLTVRQHDQRVLCANHSATAAVNALSIWFRLSDHAVIVNVITRSVITNHGNQAELAISWLVFCAMLNFILRIVILLSLSERVPTRTNSNTDPKPNPKPNPNPNPPNILFNRNSVPTYRHRNLTFTSNHRHADRQTRVKTDRQNSNLVSSPSHYAIYNLVSSPSHHPLHIISFEP